MHFIFWTQFFNNILHLSVPTAALDSWKADLSSGRENWHWKFKVSEVGQNWSSLFFVIDVGVSPRWWYSGLVFTLTHRSYQTRQQARSCFSKLCSLAEDGGIKLQVILLEKFRELLNSQEVCLCYSPSLPAFLRINERSFLTFTPLTSGCLINCREKRSGFRSKNRKWKHSQHRTANSFFSSWKYCHHST